MAPRQYGKRTNSVRRMVLGTAGSGLLLVTMILAGCGSQAGGSPDSRPVAAVSLPSMAPTDLPAPVVADPVQSYLDLVDRDSQNLWNLYTSADCSDPSSANCIQSLQAMEASVKSMDGDLKQADIPSCLASANTQLEKALGEMDTGMTGGITALRSQSYADAQQAISTLDQAVTDARQAQDALDNNSCDVSVV